MFGDDFMENVTWNLCCTLQVMLINVQRINWSGIQTADNNWALEIAYL